MVFWTESLKDLYYGNVVSFVRDSPIASKQPDSVIYVDARSGKSITRNQAFDYIGQIHTTLVTKYGLKYNDVVCVFSPNSIYYPLIQGGVLSMGGICSPANAGYTADDLKHQLEVNGAKLLVTAPKLRETAEKAVAILSKNNSNAAPRIITTDDLVKQSLNKNTEISEPIELRGYEARYKHALYCFSSGTSGMPKGVITTHQNLTSNMQQSHQTNPERFETNTSVFGAVLPMSHIYGLAYFSLHPLYRGIKTIVFEAFDFEFLLQSIIKYEINMLPVVPPIVVLFAKSPLVEKYPEVKKYIIGISSGAAPLSGSLSDATEKRLGGVAKIFQGYGLTETSPSSHNSSRDPENVKPGSVGWLLPGVEARLVDEDGKDVPEGDIGKRGELWLRGPNITRGYLKNPEATAEALTEDRWFRTGDIATVDETGQFYIVDRAKELIKSKGLQVAPAELEGILLKHPNVADAAVTGYFSEQEHTELPRAFVVMNDRNKDPLEIKRWFEDKVAKHKRLYGGIVVLDAVPKSPSGKILRRFLKERKDDKVYGFKGPGSSKL